MSDAELTIVQLKLLKEKFDKQDQWASSIIIQNAIDLLSIPVELPVKPESGVLSLETMLDNLPQNRVLYKDSGLWMIIDEEKFNTTDKMLFQVARYQQTTKETLTQFIKRCFDSENEYYITDY